MQFAIFPPAEVPSRTAALNAAAVNKARRLASSARIAARGKARQFTLASRRTQPTAAYIARLTTTATFAYLVALLIPAGTSRPVLAPLTALLVLRASVFQTIRAGLRKVAAVTAGVLTAVGVAAVVPFSWWLLGLLIAGALVLGHLLRLGDDLLEVPISAMLIFSAAPADTAADGRIVDTLVGTAAGLAAGLMFSRLRTQPAREAVSDLAGRLAGLLDGMADSLRDGPVRDAAGDPGTEQVRVGEWLTAARELSGEIGRVDDILRQAEESARLNPRSLRLPADSLPAAEMALRDGLETLEHAALTLRGLTRSVIDSVRVPSDASPVRDARTRARLAEVLTGLGTAIRTYGRLMRMLPAENEGLEAELARQLTEVHEAQDRLADLLQPRACDGQAATEWPLRGEILQHVDRLRTGLDADAIPRRVIPRQRDPHRPRITRVYRQRRPEPSRRPPATTRT